MTTLMLIERSLRQIELSLFPYLIRHEGDLFMHHTVAKELGFRTAALADILAAGLGPEPRPAFNAGCFWFAHWQVSHYWHWLTAQASDQDCKDIRAVMLRYDPAMGDPEDDDGREFVLEGLREARGYNAYSRLFRLVLDAQVLLTSADKRAALERLLAAPEPPWRPIPSRLVKDYLNSSCQSLANWRIRGTGPPPEPMEKGLGNRIYYRPDRVMSWLSGTRHAWQYSADWLAAHGVGVADQSEATVLERIQMLEKMRVLD